MQSWGLTIAAPNPLRNPNSRKSQHQSSQGRGFSDPSWARIRNITWTEPVNLVMLHFFSNRNDIALLKLASSVPLTDKIQLGCLPPAPAPSCPATTSATSRAGEDCRVSGCWGSMAPKGKGADVPRFRQGFLSAHYPRSLKKCLLRRRRIV